MKAIFLILLIGIAVVGWRYYGKNSDKPDLSRAQDKIVEGAHEMGEGVKSAFKSLTSEDVKAELRETGRVVRKKAEEAGAVISDATQDHRTTAAIKAKYAVEKDLSALGISVNTTAGVVTLSGSVDSYEAIAKAVKVALETEKVKEVISTLQVK